MDSVLVKTVQELLKEKGVEIDVASIRPHEFQGFMSEVSVADSDRGKLIIQKVRLNKEHKRQKIWKKFQALLVLLKTKENIPTSNFLVCELIGDDLLLVQDFVDGVRAGQRTIKGVRIVDEWNANEEEVITKILSALSNVHAVTLESFGWWGVHGNEEYATWGKFLENESKVWINEILENDSEFGRELLDRIMDRAIRVASADGTASLVHGDAINPSNILIKRDEITLLDWEWSIAADPAWEFCDIGWKPYLTKPILKPYFEARNIVGKDRDDFLSRVQAYAPAWLLWGVYMHIHDEDKTVYDALKTLLLQESN